MLILTRKRDETICIGDDITITVKSVRNGQVQIGIEAPRHLKVMRKEIHNVPRVEPAKKD